MLRRNTASARGLVALAAMVAACADPTMPSPVRLSPDELDQPSAAVQAAATVAMGPYTVTITDLGIPTGGTYSSAYAINNLGQVAGMSSNAAGALAPLLWTGGSFVTIPNFDASGLLIPVRINDGGDMILNESIGGTGINYAIWRQPNGTFNRLPPFPGGDALRVFARGMNAGGSITGMVREPNLAMTTHGVLWQNGAFVQDLGAMAGFQSTNPQDINDLGQVVGISTSTTNFNSTAFSWQNGTFTNLGALVAGAASSATAVNNTGTVVGTSNGGFPVRWVNGAIQSLPVPAGVIQPQPVDVNDAGDIIGWGTSSAAGVLYASAFWRNGVGYLLPAWPGATQTMARSINNNGEIVGEGPLVPGGPMHALLWKVTTGSPPPPPPPPPVGNTAPNATLVATTSTRIRAGGKVTMRGSFTDPDNGPWRYQFVWGNGTTSGTRTTAGSVTLSHRYAARGTYGVKFIVTDAKGAADTSSVVTVTVR